MNEPLEPNYLLCYENGLVHPSRVIGPGSALEILDLLERKYGSDVSKAARYIRYSHASLSWLGIKPEPLDRSQLSVSNCIRQELQGSLPQKGQSNRIISYPDDPFTDIVYLMGPTDARHQWRNRLLEHIGPTDQAVFLAPPNYVPGLTETDCIKRAEWERRYMEEAAVVVFWFDDAMADDHACYDLGWLVQRGIKRECIEPRQDILVGVEENNPDKHGLCWRMAQDNVKCVIGLEKLAQTLGAVLCSRQIHAIPRSVNA